MYSTTNMWGMPGGQATRQVTKVSNNLSEEEIKMLTATNEQFSLRLTQRDYYRGACNHRSADGLKDLCVTEPDGKLRCTICDYVFEPIDINSSEQDIIEAVQLLQNILQTIKMIYINMPAEAAREYFQIIPLLDKIPELFRIAVANFLKHENTNGWNTAERGQGTVQLFQMFNNMFNGGMMGGYTNSGMGDMMRGGGETESEPLYNARGEIVGYRPIQRTGTVDVQGGMYAGNPLLNGGRPVGAGSPEENPFVYKPTTKDFNMTGTGAAESGAPKEEVTASATLKA